MKIRAFTVTTANLKAMQEYIVKPTKVLDDLGVKLNDPGALPLVLNQYMPVHKAALHTNLGVLFALEGDESIPLDEFPRIMCTALEAPSEEKALVVADAPRVYIATASLYDWMHVIEEIELQNRRSPFFENLKAFMRTKGLMLWRSKCRRH